MKTSETLLWYREQITKGLSQEEIITRYIKKKDNISKVNSEIRIFKFRVKPHEVMSEEYPDRYYKFHNEKVAKAFWNESFGTEMLVKQL